MPSGLLPHDMLHAMRILSTPPNPRKRSYDTMALSSSSSDTSTSDSIAGRKSSPIPLPHAQNHTAVRQSTGYKTVKRNNNTMDISRSFSVEATSPPLSGYQPILQPSRGILRTMPYEVSGDLRPTYYSEKSYPTPLAPPTPYAIKAQLGEIEACRAALQSTKSQSIAEKNDKRARKRAFRVRKEMTYRVPEPVFVEVSLLCSLRANSTCILVGAKISLLVCLPCFVNRSSKSKYRLRNTPTAHHPAQQDQNVFLH